MTPLEQVEALYGQLLSHYGEGEHRELRVAAKLLLVAIDRFERHGGPGWRVQVEEYLEIAAEEPERFELMVSRNRSNDTETPF